MAETIGQAAARLVVQRETLVSGDWLKTGGDEPMPFVGTDLAELPVDTHTRWVIEMTEPAAEPVPAAEQDDDVANADAAEKPARKSRG